MTLSPITASGPISVVGSMRADGGDDRGGMDAGGDRGRRVEQRRDPCPRDQRIGGDDRHSGLRHLVLHVRMDNDRRSLRGLQHRQVFAVVQAES